MRRAHWLIAMATLAGGCTPALPVVHFAALTNVPAYLEIPLKHGADPNAPDRMGDTPLHVAARINAFARVLDLLEAGAGPRATNQRGSTFQEYLDQTPTDILHDEARR